MMTIFPQISGENVWLWIVKILTGLMIVVLMTVHFVVNHLVSEGGLLSHNDVVLYYENWYVPIMEIIFLVFAITHSLIGIRSILLDLNPPPKLKRTATNLLTILGIGFIFYGIWLVWTIRAF